MLIRILTVLTCVLISLWSSAAEINVAVASNFASPIKEIAKAYEIKEKVTVNVAIASSGKHFAQIVNGAPYHVFLSADQSKPQALQDRNLILPGSRFTYAQGQLVLVTNADNKPDPRAQLSAGDFKRVALANPKLAPYGEAAKEVLIRLGLINKYRTNWVVGENIAQTFQFLSSKNADIGFVALSQINNSRYSEQQVWVVPDDLYEPIRQDAVLLKRAAGITAAHSFYKFLQSTAAKRIIASHGYKLPGNEIKTK